jgi:hypothetical protein
MKLHDIVVSFTLMNGNQALEGDTPYLAMIVVF